MAQSVEEIEQQILDKKADNPALDSLDSPSNTALWRLIIYIIAFAHNQLQQLWDVAKNQLSIQATQSIIGTLEWYRGLALNYVGTVDITRSSCRDAGTTTVILKVAKDGVNGESVNLTDAELDEITEYIYSKEVGGTDITVMSQTADLLSIKMSVKYQGVSATIQAAVIAQIKAYIATLYDVPLSKTLLENQVLKVSGVLDCNVEELKVNVGLGYQLVTSNSLDADAGYFAIGQDSGNDLLTIVMYQ